MRHFSILIALLAIIGWAAPARAQAAQTFVSALGDDTGACTRTAPCKTFVAAFVNTATGGEIDCLDSGDFGVIFVSKSVTISCGASLIPSSIGGLIFGPARVIIDHVIFQGDQSGAGGNGINFYGSGQVIIRNSTLRDFPGAGIEMNGQASTPSPRILVQNSVITNNGGGIDVSATVSNNVEIIDTVIDSNKNYNLQVSGPSTVVLSGSTLTGTNPNSIIVSGGGAVISYGNNVLRNGGAPTSTVPLQ